MSTSPTYAKYSAPEGGRLAGLLAREMAEVVLVGSARFIPAVRPLARGGLSFGAIEAEDHRGPSRSLAAFLDVEAAYLEVEDHPGSGPAGGGA